MTTATKERKAARSGGTTLNVSELRIALQTVGHAVAARSPRPILQNVRLGDGLLTGTDLEVRIDTEIDWHGPTILLPLQRLQAILSSSSSVEDVNITPEDSACVVEIGRGRWRLPTESAVEFPTWDVEGLQPVTRLPADQFARACEAVMYAADNESSRYALGAVNVSVKGEHVRFVATDGRRLSLCQCEHDLAVDDGETLVPSRVMAILSRLANAEGDGSVQLESARGTLVATVGTTTVTAKLLEGRYPRWTDVIPSELGEPTSISREQLLAGTRAAAIVTSEVSKGVKYAFGKSLRLTGQSSEYGESSVTVDVESSGSSDTLSLDPAYVVEFLRGLPADGEPSVSVHTNGKGGACVLKCGEDFTGVIMPLDPSAA